MSYGTYHANDITGDARWGARLIANELAYEGGTGLVSNRQGASGDEAHRLVGLMQERNVLRTATAKARELGLHHDGSNDEAHTLYEDEDIIVIGSAQGSHGYLYVSAILNPTVRETA